MTATDPVGSSRHQQQPRVASSPDDVYRRYIQPFTMPSAIALVDALHLEGSEYVLDHGAGTGLVTRLLLARYPSLRVMALDPSADLLHGLSVGRLPAKAKVEKRCSTTEELHADLVASGASGAHDTPPFDAVVSNYSLQFCGDTVEELKRIRSLCRRGATGSFAVLGQADEVVPFHLYWSAVHGVVPGAATPSDYVHHKLGDPGLLVGAAAAAGWVEIDVVSEVCFRRMSAEGAWEWLSRVLPTSIDGAYRLLSRIERRAVRSRFLPSWPAGHDVPTTYHRLTARCP